MCGTLKAVKGAAFGVNGQPGFYAKQARTMTSESDSESEESSSGDDWADILGPDWRFAGAMLDDVSSIVVTDFTSEPTSENDEPMPDLLSVGSSSVWSSAEWDGWQGDDEESSDDDSIGRPSVLRKFMMEEINTMYEGRYENPRDTLPRGPSYLYHVLTALKAGREDHFRQALRISPQTFDDLVARLDDDPVFSSIRKT
ncbi:hypothetical protein B0H12DRAFT_1230932 [Mycena haematopus]|nr:hypothetical protein B0H12DRAFT_1230932 [Mycena haematopus]